MHLRPLRHIALLAAAALSSVGQTGAQAPGDGDALLPGAAAASSPRSASSCEGAVRGFFDWYVPLAQKQLGRPAFETAIHRRPAAFSRELVRALERDLRVQQAARPGEAAGLDFDPFLGSQDPEEHYDIRNVRQQGTTCTAEIWRRPRTEAPEATPLPDAVAELHDAGGWRFSDFRYPALHADLKQVLASEATKP